MELAKLANSGSISAAYRSKEVLGLVLQLSEIRADRQMAFRHTSLLVFAPQFADAGEKEVRENRNGLCFRSGGLSPAREREASCTPKARIAPGKAKVNLNPQRPQRCSSIQFEAFH
jgi:hypothetical protein